LTFPRIKTIDIETSPLESYTWGLWQQNVGLNQIKTEWSILSFAAKDMGSKDVRYYDCGGYGADEVRNDMHLLHLLWEELDSADIVVAQNGKRFDMKKINARLIAEGFPPYSPVRVIDTMLAARATAAFTSNKLEYLTDKLTKTKKQKHKNFPGFELWAECLKDNPRAWKEMRAYNIPDVISTEELYVVLRPWIIGHPNVAAYNPDGEVIACPKCGSEDIHNHGPWYTQANEYVMYRCGSCGGFSRSRYTRSTIERRRSLLTN
jgi:RNase_H superfamily